MSAPNCYRCRYRGALPGDAHSSCAHPVALVAPTQALGLLMLTGKVEAKPIPPGLPDGFRLVAHDHGISRGWCAWPLNFDPIWIRECTGFAAHIPSPAETENQEGA